MIKWFASLCAFDADVADREYRAFVLGERRLGAVAEHEVHVVGPAALDALELVCVEEQLEDVPRLRMAAAE